MYLLDIYLTDMSKKKQKKGAGTAEAMLGLLSIGPMTGYDIRNLIPTSIGHFWQESYGQIYPTLAKLEKKKLVSVDEQRAWRKPLRKVYKLTKEGRGELRAWLERPVAAMEVPRSEVLLKLFFGNEVAREVSAEHVATVRTEHMRAAALYAAMEKELKREHGSDPRLPFWLMTLNFGKHRSAAIVAWCEETLGELQRGISLQASAAKKKPAKKAAAKKTVGKKKVVAKETSVSRKKVGA